MGKPILCRIPGCTDPVEANGICAMHRARLQNGTPMDQPKRRQWTTWEDNEVMEELLEQPLRYRDWDLVAATVGRTRGAVIRRAQYLRNRLGIPPQRTRHSAIS